ncbi:MAG: hypothetical protein A3K65_05300 [Euryarchaeota archaeon RBG_16_68_12]|nr:MAG: hypothetical protein A3K65_05300 [Euryarchaeota archaeon RBG_16_68_12]
MGLKMDATEADPSGVETPVPVIEWRGRSYEPRVLLHFDIRASDGTVRRRVDRILYGFKESRVVHGSPRTYRYPGVLERTDGRHCGQSVVILSEQAADEAYLFLREMKVPCQRVEILSPDWV